jgi:hypothetical protein
MDANLAVGSLAGTSSASEVTFFPEPFAGPEVVATYTGLGAFRYAILRLGRVAVSIWTSRHDGRLDVLEPKAE